MAITLVQRSASVASSALEENPWATPRAGNSEDSDENAAASPRDTDKGKGKAADAAPIIDITPPFDSGWVCQQDAPDPGEPETLGVDGDWIQHDPPEALLALPEGTSDIITSLINTSIQNVREQMAREETARREREAEAERLRAEEEDRRALNAPEVFVETAPSEASTHESGDRDGPSDDASQHAPGPRKIRRGLARFLRHVRDGPGKAESSAAAAKRFERFSASGADLVLAAAVTPTIMFASMKDRGKGKEKEEPPKAKTPEPEETV